MADVTVILTTYARRSNWPAIRAGIRRQRATCELWVWDNSNGPRVRGADQQFRSSKNLLCWPRWFVASQAATDIVLIVDDDLVFVGRDVVSSLCDALEGEPEGTLAGAEGVSLRARSPYWPKSRALMERSSDVVGGRSSVHVRNVLDDTRVDIVKGRCVAVRRADLGRLPLAVPHFEYADDIAVSAILGRGRPKPHLIPSSVTDQMQDCRDSHGPMALHAQKDWKSKRDIARQHYFPGGAPLLR